MERHYSQHGKEVVPAKDSIPTIGSISASNNQNNFLLPIHSELQKMDTGNEGQLKHGRYALHPTMQGNTAPSSVCDLHVDQHIHQELFKHQLT